MNNPVRQRGNGLLFGNGISHLSLAWQQNLYAATACSGRCRVRLRRDQLYDALITGNMPRSMNRRWLLRVIIAAQNHQAMNNTINWKVVPGWLTCSKQRSTSPAAVGRSRCHVNVVAAGFGEHDPAQRVARRNGSRLPGSAGRNRGDPPP